MSDHNGRSLHKKCWQKENRVFTWVMNTRYVNTVEKRFIIFLYREHLFLKKTVSPPISLNLMISQILRFCPAIFVLFMLLPASGMLHTAEFLLPRCPMIRQLSSGFAVCRAGASSVVFSLESVLPLESDILEMRGYDRVKKDNRIYV